MTNILDDTITFLFTGLDFDLYQKDQKDRQPLPEIEKEIKKVRSSVCKSA